MYAVELHSLSKTYPGGKQAVKNVSLSLEPGEVFGFLGPNGAGKTTTVKLLNGMLTPTEGTCRVLGADPAREPEKVHAAAGVVTEHARMYDNLTGLQNLVFYAEIFGIPAEEAGRRAAALLGKMELEDAKDRKLAAWSTGMRQRLSLARALIHRPKVLFLDEPTSGLDVMARRDVLDILREYMEEDETRSILISSHISTDLENLCDDIYMIHDGKIILHEDTDVLMGQYGLVKVDEEQFAKLDRTYIISVRRESYGYACLTDQKQYYRENYPGVVVENGMLDEIIAMMIGGERL